MLLVLVAAAVLAAPAWREVDVEGKGVDQLEALARTAVRKHDYCAAVQLLRACHHLDPNHVQCHLLSGIVHSALEDGPYGAWHYQRFLAGAPKHRSAGKVSAILDTYRRAGGYVAARHASGVTDWTSDSLDGCETEAPDLGEVDAATDNVHAFFDLVHQHEAALKQCGAALRDQGSSGVRVVNVEVQLVAEGTLTRVGRVKMKGGRELTKMTRCLTNEVYSWHFLPLRSPTTSFSFTVEY